MRIRRFNESENNTILSLIWDMLETLGHDLEDDNIASELSEEYASKIEKNGEIQSNLWDLLEELDHDLEYDDRASKLSDETANKIESILKLSNSENKEIVYVVIPKFMDDEIDENDVKVFRDYKECKKYHDTFEKAIIIESPIK